MFFFAPTSPLPPPSTLRSLHKKNMPASLKVIQARLVAQAGVIVGICGAGVASFVLHDTKKKKDGLMIRELAADFSVAPTMAAAPEEEEEGEGGRA
jgi:hypothetical protein